MQPILTLSVLCVSAFLQIGSSTIIRNNIPGIQGANRQIGGISFAIPGLSLLGGNNVGVGGNFFGQVTVTRTLVSTVSTVTTASFRTCTMPVGALSACVAGRRRRDLDDSDEVGQIRPTPIVQLIIGSTTITNPDEVTEYLEAHKPSMQSVIYPPGVEINESDKVKINSTLDAVVGETTVLYPSQDTPETTDIPSEDDMEEWNDSKSKGGTETQYLPISDGVLNEELVAETTPNVDQELNEKARVGLGRTTTLTTIIRVTSVATTLATGTSATLMVTYGGCLPQSLPVTGIPCT